MGTFLEWVGLRRTQLEQAAILSNRIYNDLRLDGLSTDAKIIKLALFVDVSKTTGEEIDLETVFKLVGGKLQVQAMKERAKAMSSLDVPSFDTIIKENH